MYNTNTFCYWHKPAISLALQHYSKSGKVILYSLSLQGTEITQMIGGACSLHNTVLQIYYAVFFPYINVNINIRQYLTMLLQKYRGPIFIGT